MKQHHSHGHGPLSQSRGRHGSSEPAFQIICLGSGGGPSENNVTGFLVRSVAKNWSKGSVLAVDAGCHLASIVKLLEPSFPLVSELHPHPHPQRPNGSGLLADDQSSETSASSSRTSSPELQTRLLDHGPFAGLPFPYESARANALHIVRECVSTYLITHPHLDHLSAFVINTAAFHNTSRPKKLAALPSTVNAIKAHIFNDIIWPNLTDEDGGVGFVTFQRLAQGGNIAVGEGSGKGYIEVCDGLCVKGLKISHGHCARGPDPVGHRGSDVGLSEATVFRPGFLGPMAESPVKARRTPSFPQLLPHQSSFPLSQPGTPAAAAAAAAAAGSQAPAAQQHSSELGHRDVVVDSTAYFIRDDSTRREILFFGDVEPDSLSLNPRTVQVWTEATPKIAHGTLRAIFLECSYDDSQADSILFGHLAPRHLFRELQTLAGMVKAKKVGDKNKKEGKKRKHMHASSAHADHTDASGPPTEDELHHRKKHSRHSHGTDAPDGHMHRDSPSPTSLSHPEPSTGAKIEAPLVGVTVVVIHVKDTLRDGPVVGERILEQLQEHDAHLKQADGTGLGCEFVVCESGASYWF